MLPFNLNVRINICTPKKTTLYVYSKWKDWMYINIVKGHMRHNYCTACWKSQITLGRLAVVDCRVVWSIYIYSHNTTQRKYFTYHSFAGYKFVICCWLSMLECLWRSQNNVLILFKKLK